MAKLPSQAPKHSLGQILFILKFAGKFFWQTNRRFFLSVILLNSIGSLIIIPNLLLDKYFIDILVSGVSSPDKTAVFNGILLIVVSRLGLALLRTLSQRLSGFYARIFLWRTYQRLENLVGLKYSTIPVSLLEQPDFKDRLNRLEREGIGRMQRVGENFVRIPQHVTGMISSLSFFFTTQPFVILLSIFSLLPALIVDRIFIRRDYQQDLEITTIHRKRSVYSYYLRNSRSYLEARLLGIHIFLADKVSKYWDEIISLRTKLQRSWRSWGYLAGIFDNVISYSFDVLFAFEAIIGRITIGTAQAYIRAISSFKSSVTDLTANFMELYESYFYLNDLNWFLDLDTPDFSGQGKKLGETSDLTFEFSDVWFKYPGTDSWVLRGVNLLIKPGENIALVGKNGAGKTTFVKLLCGFYSPTKGKVTVNGIKTTELDKIDYWKKLSVLFQESDAFGISVKEIVSAGDLSRQNDHSGMQSVLKAALIDDWVNSLPRKYDNPIGRDFDQGVTPSSGQWQKLVIARTLFKDSPVMILDEPTSNVDPQAEEDIFNQIITIGLKKTLLFISHRFSTVRRADRIIVFEDGRITESGSHDQLMHASGTYARLFKLQAKSYR
jgi:ATP-binding cassette subfamily B protein